MLRPTILLLATLAACGATGDAADTDTTSADTAAAVEAPAAAPAAPPAEPTDAPLVAADVERYAKGLDAELEAVRQAGAQLKAAKSGTDTLSALDAASERRTRAAGAAAAGVSEDRWQFVRGHLGELATAMVPSAMETNGQMPAPMVAQIKQGREDGLAKLAAQTPAEVVEALKPRAQALADQQLRLAGERLRLATGR
ncbi:hypothetical protein [Roseisolibacter sp. H3M3-2]|uniref:hypothetical protein n=1 Tax=Roseisolibacter sp. H3M3-2 TaxID=3031323 RepID=UPI0023DC3970|nr:hypothetical protein [Roseisolibacter sp. H3M3-2]MDF1504257.1 hypothetical protein [Roseisolibacter sp. H3M3-2]